MPLTVAGKDRRATGSLPGQRESCKGNNNKQAHVTHQKLVTTRSSSYTTTIRIITLSDPQRPTHSWVVESSSWPSGCWAAHWTGSHNLGSIL